MFAEINFENLSQEMAQGHGEHLASLATLMGVPVDQQPAFFALTQEQYTSLTQSGETAPVATIKALNAALSAHPALAQLSTNRCATLGLAASLPGPLPCPVERRAPQTTG